MKVEMELEILKVNWSVVFSNLAKCFILRGNF
jgi:hypothetical protein